MTTKEQVQRESKSNGLRVFRTADDQYYVESSEGKIAYRVSGSNGSKSCSCGAYTNEIREDSFLSVQAYSGCHQRQRQHQKCRDYQDRETEAG